jgi:amino acid transporter
MAALLLAAWILFLAFYGAKWSAQINRDARQQAEEE